ncbi:MAG: OB-fold putative lipoprotein [Gemmataceae bacterium]|nr:OB-fold putative lipoprotein [Gemmataceae bacterium]
MRQIPAGTTLWCCLVLTAIGCGRQDAPNTTVAAAKKDGDASPKADKAPLPPPPGLTPQVFPPPPHYDIPTAKTKQPAVTKPKVPVVPVKKTRVKPTATVSLTAEAFGGEIQKDAEAAERKYESVFVELTGTVNNVGSRDREPFVTLDAGPESLSILCLLAQEKEPWAKISKGQKIKVRGQWPDVSVQPTLEACVLVDLGANPAKEINAETLAAEFAKNKDGVRKQYADKPLIVTGVIDTARPRNDLGAVSVYLKGAGAVVVDCGFNAVDRAEAFALKRGDAVRVVGEFSLFESSDGPALRGCRVITTK